jgi:predicted esterase
VGGYLLKHTKTPNLGKIPLLLMHGDQDTVIHEAQPNNPTEVCWKVRR